MAMSGFSDAGKINLKQPWTNKKQIIKMSIHEAIKENIATTYKLTMLLNWRKTI